MIRYSTPWVGLMATACMHAALAVDRPVSPDSPDFIFAQAIRYEHGQGVAKDASRAAALYCAAARKGDPEAAYRLGSMYANGRGVPREAGYAVALYQRAAAQGHDGAKYMVGVLRNANPVLPDCVVAPGTVDFATAAEKQQVSEAIATWMAAWSRKDVDAYLAAYSSDFVVPAGRLRRQWEEERRARIAGKTWIAVSYSALEVRVRGSEAQARMVQDYRSDQLNQTSRKTLTLAQAGGRWLIRQEQDTE